MKIINLFFNTELELKIIAKNIFSILGANSNEIFEGVSSYSKNETYYHIAFLGLKLIIDENNYDYEDKYKFRMSIRNDVLSKTKVDQEIIDSSSELIIKLILMNLNIEILAVEEEIGKLRIFSKANV